MLKDTIKRIATEKGFTLREVARESGVPYSAMLEWNNSMPSALALVRVCSVLGTTAEKVLGGKEE